MGFGKDVQAQAISNVRYAPIPVRMVLIVVPLLSVLLCSRTGKFVDAPDMTSLTVSNSLPIALIQSLVVEVPGLKWGHDDTKDQMLGRALTYLVLYSTLGMMVRLHN